MYTETPYTDATPLLADPVALRAQMARDGFLFLRGLFTRATVLDLRRRILLILNKYGWLDRNADLMDGVVDPSVHAMVPECGVGVTVPAYEDVYKTEAFHRLAHHPAVVSLMAKLMGETVLIHPRHIARMMFPVKSTAPTPPHQDHIFIQGAKAVYTCWLPLGDCPESMGGLQVMRGSHTLGVLPVRAAEGAGGRSVILDGLDQEWTRGDLSAGDVLIFHSLTVHRAVPNTYPDRVRLSVDYRYQPVSLPVEEKSLLPHCNLLPWDQIYAGWQTTDMQYDWRQYPLTYATFDDALLTIQPG
ncbi:MAG: phytanoyl-CoA dioxygenase family protein [Anaerolineales bacterium]|nr:phytanoyl-CoA dioxygenase family protein [Anaerolineales bacterium]